MEQKQIPAILAEAYTDNPEAKPKSLTLWSVTIDSNDPKDARASVILMKFLRARCVLSPIFFCIVFIPFVLSLTISGFAYYRNLNTDAAAKMLIATIRWRDEFKVDEVLKEEFPEDVFGKLGYVYGKDKGGRPVTYVLSVLGVDTMLTGVCLQV